MSISLFSESNEELRVVSFGHHGFRRKHLPDGTHILLCPNDMEIRIGTRVRFVKKKGTRRTFGIGNVPYTSEGVVVNFDFLTRSKNVLRVVFTSLYGRKTNPLSISPYEIEIISS